MSRTVKKINGEQMSQKITPKNARKVIKPHDREAKIADMAYYKVQIGNLVLGHELEDWPDTENEFHF